MEKGGKQVEDFEELEALGFSKEEMIQILTQAREKEKIEVQEISETMVPSKTNPGSAPEGSKKQLSWADLAEAEETAESKTDAPPSWADIARANRDPRNGMPLSFISPTEILQFSAAELTEGAKLWNSSLIGMVVGASPNYGEVCKYVNSAWRDIGHTRIHQLRKGIYLFDFSSEEDRAKALEGRWSIYNRFPLLLKPWTPGMEIGQCFNKIPIWVQFPGLNLDLWETRNLSKVASYIGKPITTDACTADRKRMAFARVLIEVPLDGKLPNFIPIKCCEGSVQHQQVVYEWKPVRCSNCGWLGHDLDMCRRNKGKERESQPKRNEDSNKVNRDTRNPIKETIPEEKKGEVTGSNSEHSKADEIARSTGAVEKQNGKISKIDSKVGEKQTGQRNQVTVNKTPILHNLQIGEIGNKLTKDNIRIGMDNGKMGSDNTVPNG